LVVGVAVKERYAAWSRRFGFEAMVVWENLVIPIWAALALPARMLGDDMLIDHGKKNGKKGGKKGLVLGGMASIATISTTTAATAVTTAAAAVAMAMGILFAIKPGVNCGELSTR
jgi:hypothetical protein